MMTPAEEHIWLRGESGAVFPHKLPLPDGIQDRLDKGYLTRVADEHGNPYVEPVPEPEPPHDPPVTLTGDDSTPDPAASQDPPAPAGPLPLPAWPRLADAKKAWVGYVVHNLEIAPDEAEARTKHDLIDLVRAAAAARGQAFD